MIFLCKKKTCLNHCAFTLRVGLLHEFIDILLNIKIERRNTCIDLARFSGSSWDGPNIHLFLLKRHLAAMFVSSMCISIIFFCWKISLMISNIFLDTMRWGEEELCWKNQRQLQLFHLHRKLFFSGKRRRGVFFESSRSSERFCYGVVSHIRLWMSLIDKFTFDSLHYSSCFAREQTHEMNFFRLLLFFLVLIIPIKCFKLAVHQEYLLWQ